jgi:hypothetical protein
MATLHLLALTCVSTLELREDEPYLLIRADGLRVTRTETFELSDGESIALDLHIRFITNVQVELWEQDSDSSVDRHLRDWAFSRGHSRLGEFRGEIRTSRAHYILTYEVTEAPVRNTYYAIDLDRLHCANAQERTDEVFLKVNGLTVWGPTDMRTGNTISLHCESPPAVEDEDNPCRINFHRNVMVDLYEEDRTRVQLLGTLVLPLIDVEERVIRGGGPFNVEIHWESSLGMADCTYILTYRLCRIAP